MSLSVNLRHLEAQNAPLEGALPASELDIETRDDIIQLGAPLKYNLEVQKLENALLVRGCLHLTLQCRCVRCLKPLDFELRLDPWTLHLPLEGEDAAVISNDCVDLTPYVREDILLEFPQHPLCKPECGGLPKTNIGKSKNTSGGPARLPAWDELNKLKF